MSPQLLKCDSDQRGILRGVEQRVAFHEGFYAKHGKRALDVFSSILGLIALAPVFVLVGCCIKLNSRGGVFFRQDRVGLDGRLFRILKFRSMVMDPSKKSPRITVSGDSRVTAVGSFLRRYKIDELPQLWNVLWGDMSLVGPRPELPVYVALYTPDQRRVLSVRPGITDPASLAYRNEEHMFAGQEEPEQSYVTRILPEKLARSMDYLQQVSFRYDLRIIFHTVKCSLFFSGNTQK